MKKSINRNCEPQTANFTDRAARLHHQVCRVVSVYSFTCHITVKHGPSPAGREKVKARSLHPTSLLTSLKELRSLQSLHFVFAKLFILVNRWNDNITIILLGKLHPHSQSISCHQGKQTMSQLQQWALFWWLDMWSPKSVWHSDISLYKPAQHSLQYHLTVLWLYVAFDLFLFQCNIKPGLGN